jgi:hypothetical protein
MWKIFSKGRKSLTILVISLLDDLFLFMGGISFMTEEAVVQTEEVVTKTGSEIIFGQNGFWVALILTLIFTGIFICLLFRKWLSKKFEPIDDRYESVIKILVAVAFGIGIGVLSFYFTNWFFGVQYGLGWFMGGGGIGALLGIIVEYFLTGKNLKNLKDDLSKIHELTDSVADAARANGIDPEEFAEILKEANLSITEKSKECK